MNEQRFTDEQNETRRDGTTRREPAADAVERAARALANHAAEEGENWYVDDDGTEHFPKWEDLPDDDTHLGGGEWPNPGRNHVRANARVALDAAAPHGDLDDQLTEIER